MSRTIYDIDQAGTVICTYTDSDSEKESLKTVGQASVFSITTLYIPMTILRLVINYSERSMP